MVNGLKRALATLGACVALFTFVAMLSADPAAAQSGGPTPRDTWTCSASVDFWQWQSCPYLAPGTYTFENTNPTDNGDVVLVCPNSGAQCNNLMSGYCDMPHPTDQCNGAVNSDQMVGIQGFNWLAPQEVSFSAVPYTPGTAGPRHETTPQRLSAER